MNDRLFPERIDNDFRGCVFAVWLFAPIVAVKLLMGFNITGLNPWIASRTVAEMADGIPITSIGVQFEGHILYLFSGLGLSMLTMSILSTIVLVRYRAMIPIMYLMLMIEQWGRLMLSNAHLGHLPTHRAEVTSGAIINWTLSVALVAGFVLSLVSSRKGVTTPYTGK